MIFLIFTSIKSLIATNLIVIKLLWHSWGLWRLLWLLPFQTFGWLPLMRIPFLPTALSPCLPGLSEQFESNREKKKRHSKYYFYLNQKEIMCFAVTIVFPVLQITGWKERITKIISFLGLFGNSTGQHGVFCWSWGPFKSKSMFETDSSYTFVSKL